MSQFDKGSFITKEIARTKQEPTKTYRGEGVEFGSVLVYVRKNFAYLMLLRYLL